MIRMKAIAAFIIITFLTACSGSDESYLTIGTFNIEWLGDGINDRLPRTKEDYRKIAGIIEQSGADILALQEIENKKALKLINSFLDGYSIYISRYGGSQKTAYLVNNSVDVDYITEYSPLRLGKRNLRPGLVMKARKGGFSFVMMNVHLKSTSGYDAAEGVINQSIRTRRSQAELISHWVDSLEITAGEKNVIILGDFNDTPKRKKDQSLESLVKNEGLFFLTSGLKSCRHKSWYNIDQIIVTESPYERFIRNSVRMISLDAAFSAPEVKKISDHCPVTAQFYTGRN